MRINKTLRLALTGLLIVGLVFSFAGCGKKKEEGGSLQIRGSDTMLQLSTSWAEAYMKANPDVQIAVSGGGSGTGIAAMINGTVDIANASRLMKDKEKEECEANGITPVEHVVAKDGISVVVNPANPVRELTMGQIKDIYTGKVTNWKEVGGPDHEITLAARDNSSGTYAFFQKNVLMKEDYSPKALNLQSNSAIVEEVAQNEYAIGYIGLGYLVDAGDKVAAVAVDGVKPDNKSVASGEYKIARGLQMYTNGEPEGLPKAFLDFIMSEEGQKIVEAEGFVPLK
ncbi:phosphate ABC transporter substrate-binding protein PstS family protein [candidate division WOR-3 bacterium]|nr:phosphate ABC transporter substrate-binding protein PstS family protein [candidate division WOR-3 bacterium]